MKTLLLTLLTITSAALQAQEYYATKQQRQEELLKVIKNDTELNSQYVTGKILVKTGNILGFTSLTLITLGYVTAKSFSPYVYSDSGLAAIYVILVSSVGASIAGISGIFVKINGKSKIDAAMDSAQNKVQLDMGFWEFKTTENGVGIVYSF